MFNVLGHRYDDDPVPAIYLGPTRNNITTVIEPKISEMIRSVPSLYEKLSKGKKDNKIKKIIAGIPLRMAWAGSATEMASDSALSGHG